MNSDAVIIGGGAAGLMAAIVCLRRGRQAVILEQKDVPGRKILATGNGRCNFSNLHMDENCYRGGVKRFPNAALRRFGPQEAIQFFEELGVMARDRQGALFPCTNQAASVRDALCSEARRLGAHILCGVRVEHIRKKDGLFEIVHSGGTEQAGRVILAAGGAASPVHGSDGSGFALARELGHRVTPLCPSLTGLKAEEPFCRDLAGVRAEATLSLLIDGRFFARDTGEVQLTASGVSGIPAFQLCRHAGTALAEQKAVTVKADFFPALKGKELKEQLLRLRERFAVIAAREALSGMMNKTLLAVLLPLAGIGSEAPLGEAADGSIAELCRQMKGLAFTITGTGGFDTAQVCAGGVDTSEVNADTMESLLVKNLYFAGEILDVDGICGGYNLQWAWASGFAAGFHAAGD